MVMKFRAHDTFFIRKGWLSKGMKYVHAKDDVFISKNESKLTLKEAEVIKLRYGYYGKERTLEEVGKQFGVTRERIRQIETKAIRKLRHPSRAKHLRDFL